MPGLRTIAATLSALAVLHSAAHAQQVFSPLPAHAQQATYEAPLPAGSPAPFPLNDARDDGVQLTPPGQAPLPRLTPPSGDAQSARGGGSTLTLLASLAMVIGLFLLTAWAMRRGLGTGTRSLPNEVVEVLGRCPLPGRQQAHLLRCGNKLVLVALSSAGADTITEITDPLEVDRLAGLCLAAQPASATSAFRQLVAQFSQGGSLEYPGEEEEEHDAPGTYRDGGREARHG